MATVGDIAITVGADIGPMVRELGKAKGQLGSFESSAEKLGRTLGSAFGIATVSVGATVTAVVALTRASMQNIDALSKQARAVGISVASFQSMAMVAEEAGVESDKLSKILIKMQDNIASLGSGASAQVDAFQSLGLSMSDLAGLGADAQFALIAEKIAEISDPATKTAAALNVFGKSGADAITMLDGYGAAADEAAAFQRQFGLAVTDTDAQNIEAANDAMGRMGMVMEGLGNKLAALASGPLVIAANGFVDLAASILGVKTASVEIQNYAAILEEFGKTDPIAAMVGSWTALTDLVKQEDAVQSIMNMTDAYNDLFAAFDPGVSGMMVEIEDLRGHSVALGEGVKLVVSEAKRLGAELQRAINEGRIEDAKRLKGELEDTVEKLQLSLEGAEKLSGLDMSGAISWADQLAAAFGRVAKAAADAAASAAEIPGMDLGVPLSGDAAGLMPPTFDSGMDSSLRPGQRPIDWVPGEPTGLGKGGGGRGGGGGSNPMTARIKSLIESLKTEKEIVDQWYKDSLEALNAASAAELEAVGGKHEALERLEEEHQKRLGQIKEMGNKWGLQAALDGGAEIFSAMGAMNKKALKAASIFSAAQALISTYEGAAKELKKGTFGFASAAAVIAKGIGFVAAIKSAGNGGGVASGGGSGGAVAAAPPPQVPVTTMNFTVQNDPFGYGERFARNIAEQMNAARRSGSSIIATVSSP